MSKSFYHYNDFLRSLASKLKTEIMPSTAKINPHEKRFLFETLNLNPSNGKFGKIVGKHGKFPVKTKHEIFSPQIFFPSK